MNKRKAVIIVGLIFVLLCVLAADIVALYPKTLVWILGVFAIPGLWGFCKLLYWWVTTEDDRGIQIRLPFARRKKKKSVFDTVWAGKPTEESK